MFKFLIILIGIVLGAILGFLIGLLIAIVWIKVTDFVLYLVNSRRYEKARIGEIESEFKKEPDKR